MSSNVPKVPKVQSAMCPSLTICRNLGLEKINQFNESLNNNSRPKKMNAKPQLQLNLKKKKCTEVFIQRWSIKICFVKFCKIQGKISVMKLHF